MRSSEAVLFRGPPMGRVMVAAIISALALVFLVTARPTAAQAQIPDSGAQRAEMVQQQRITNERLSQIIELLTEIRDLQRGGPQVREKKPAPLPSP